MQKKQRVSMRTIGYLLLWGGIALLLVRGCSFVLSLTNGVSQPDIPSSPQPGFSAVSVENGTIYFVVNNTIHALNARNGEHIWQNFSGGSNPPVVANGVVYDVNFREINALNGSDGMLLWRYFPSDDGETVQPGNLQIVQVTGDRLYVYDDQVLDVVIAGKGIAGTGIRAWSTNDSVNAVDINTLTISNGVAYYAVHVKSDATTTPTPVDSAIVARRASDGKMLWTYSLSETGQSCGITSMKEAFDAVYAGVSCDNGAGRTFALRGSDGAMLWQYMMSGQLSVADGVVGIHISQASATLADLYVLQANTGKLLWQDAPGTSQGQNSVWTPGNGYVYLLENGMLKARRLSDGEAVWSMGFAYNAAAPTFETFSDPVFLGALDNMIYLQSSVVDSNTHVAYNRLYAVQASTGKQVWSFSQGEHDLTWSAVSVDAGTGTLEVQGLDTQHATAVYLLRGADGGLVGSLLESQQANSVLIEGGTIYVTSSSGDGENTPFSYHVRALRVNNQGEQTLWAFTA